MAQIKPISGAEDRVLLAEALPLVSPFTLNVFPTNACNFKCSYCAQSLGAEALAATYGMDRGFMSLETMELIVEQSKAFAPYKLLSFMGHGEPLLNRDLPKMISLAARAGIAQRIEIITNASMLTHEYADELIDSGLTNLRVSLQGLDMESYRKICGVALDFDRFMERLVYFYTHKKKDMGLFVKIMDVSLPIGGAKEFYKLFNNICDRMYVENVQPVYHAVDVHSSNGSDLTRYDRYGNAHPPRTVCPLAFFSLAVWPNGDVQPCDAIYKPCVLGNVHNTNLREMWDSELLKQFRIRHLRGEKEIITGCSNCCAPDDVSHPLDALDDRKDEILCRLFG
ncbi:Radical SAM domain protein [Desulfitobacterium hafniense DCB-2]|uniref:Radical SAM domain protein n=1 Tax=Desulfitobacterium hafniense (strain DSM 10664 / DCB-2) TaxID=272564 RepID=B8FTT8_DESHD|nr:radical SAM protein [Desulfitobacterium hafniense]ACL22180.1 Radical SAM domain protein [Desulfitobacterium hafniense DCB-2]